MSGKFFRKPKAEESARVPPGQHLAKGFPYSPTETLLKLAQMTGNFVFGA